jgi:type VI secretion system secreted protein Hcp
MKIRKALGSLFFALLLTSTSSTAWAEITGPTVLSLDGVSTEVLAWSWGASNSATFHVGGGGGAGKANFQDLSVTRLTDYNSIKFIQNVSTGAILDTVTLTRGNLTITLGQTLITSYSVGGVSEKKEPTIENISINFQTVTFQIDGVSFCFNPSTGTACGG